MAGKAIGNTFRIQLGWLKTCSARRPDNSNVSFRSLRRSLRLTRTRTEDRPQQRIPLHPPVQSIEFSRAYQGVKTRSIQLGWLAVDAIGSDEVPV